MKLRTCTVHLVLPFSMILAAPCFAGSQPQPYRKWSSNGALQCEIPSQWKFIQGETGGRTLFLRGPGHRVDYPLSPNLYLEFVADAQGNALQPLMRAYDSELPEAESKGREIREITVDGRKAFRISAKHKQYVGATDRVYNHTPTPEELKQEQKTSEAQAVWLPEAIVFVPVDGGFWMIQYKARKEDFAKYAPLFEHLLATTHFDSAKKP